MKPEAKKKIVLDLLLQGYHLTKLQIFEKALLTNGGDTIFQLRNAGHNIKTRMEVNKSTKSRFAVYFIPKEL